MLKLNYSGELTDQQHYIVPSLEEVSNNLIALVKQQLNVPVLSNTQSLMEVEAGPAEQVRHLRTKVLKFKPTIIFFSVVITVRYLELISCLVCVHFTAFLSCVPATTPSLF